jgi:4-hydroxy-3-methylbut-2-en-1-yl diphosphate reductase
MKIYRARAAGFCFGVKRAVDMAYKCAQSGEKGNVYSLHEIIHNPQEVERLERAGAKHVEDISGIRNRSTVIVSTHGITPEEEHELERKQLKVLDTTCPYVKKIHRIVEKLAEEGYDILIVGDRDHLEVKGIKGHAGARGSVITGPADVKKARTGMKTGIVSQTTQNEKEYREIIGLITEKAFRVRQAEVRAFHTICDATQQRQDETVKLAKKTDIMIIIGGKNSANTRRLFELSKKVLKNTRHVEDASEIRKSWFKNCRAAGVSGGASTPEAAIEGAVKRIREMTVK